jgi:hypothetical protein
MENPAVHESSVAQACSSLADIYYNTQRYSEIEPMYNESLKIYKRLAVENPAVYNPILVQINNNLTMLRNKYTPNYTKQGQTGKASKSAGRAMGFAGRLIWTIFNFALAATCVIAMFRLNDIAWYLYLLFSAVAIFLLVNGVRCISGRSYWIFY